MGKMGNMSGKKRQRKNDKFIILNVGTRGQLIVILICILKRWIYYT